MLNNRFSLISHNLKKSILLSTIRVGFLLGYPIPRKKILIPKVENPEKIPNSGDQNPETKKSLILGISRINPGKIPDHDIPIPGFFPIPIPGFSGFFTRVFQIPIPISGILGYSGFCTRDFSGF